MATGQMCKLWAAGLVVVALACVLRAAGQEDPGQPARRQAARDVIAVLTGDNLTDAERVSGDCTSRSVKNRSSWS